MKQLHVFLSSPGDVSQERALAREVLDQLESEDRYKDHLKIEVVAWEKPGVETAMPAHMEPQEAIAAKLKNPSQCDVVIVILWSRLGTPLSEKYSKPGGGRYRSGTEYEFLDGLEAAKRSGKPIVLVYRGTKELEVRANDPQRDARLSQWDLVTAFFSEFRNPDGSIRHNYKEYGEPHEFRSLLERDLRPIVERVVGDPPGNKASATPVSPDCTWPQQKAPYPGLRPFTPKEAPVFRGRDRETGQLLDMLGARAKRFVAVVGASGSGKSSLVWAGLLPALAKGAIHGTQDWVLMRFTPAEFGDNPFTALAAAFKPILDSSGVSPKKMADALAADPAALDRYRTMALAGRPDWAELLFFIDQFEEFFTAVHPDQQKPFVDLLATAAGSERVRLVLTMRSDFFHRCLDFQVLNRLVADGQYSLLPPGVGALHEMIVRPAEMAGFRLEDGLVEKILDHTGTAPGALAQMAFALEALYKCWQTSPRTDRVLTHAAYESFGGVRGAIGRRAEDAFKGLKGEEKALDDAFGHVFRELVEVNEAGTATRRKAARSRLEAGELEQSLLIALIDARLLMTSQDENDEAVVEVAHEAIFSHWPRLQQWIRAYGDALHLRRQIEQAAERWEKDDRHVKHLWPDERVPDVAEMVKRLGLTDDDFSESEKDFLGPFDRDAMLQEIEKPATAHERRAVIGRRLSLLGDPRPGVGLRPDGLPDIAWCKVPGGEVVIEGVHETFGVDPFFIAKYPVTWVQYEAFLTAKDGYKIPACWRDTGVQFDKPGRQFNPYTNHPAENMCWYEAVAFCRWLSDRLGYEIKLPTEWQWQRAAIAGDLERFYPWPGKWDNGRANTYESELGRTTAVGMYPHGASPVGAMGMAGNVWEFCLNEFDRPCRVELTGEARRVLRGGSFRNKPSSARAAFRYAVRPLNPYDGVGFRVSCVFPIV